METYTIRQARRLADLSQSQVAKALGVCECTYRKIERNPEKATVEQAHTLARLFGLPYDCLFFSSNSN